MTKGLTIKEERDMLYSNEGETKEEGRYEEKDILSQEQRPNWKDQ